MNTNLLNEINESEIEAGNLAFWWLGQQGWCVKTVSRILYFDPYLSPREKRNFPPVFAPENVSNADVVLCTHDHLDHIDHPALPLIMNNSVQANLIVPPVAKEELVSSDGIAQHRILPLQAGESLTYRDMRVTAIKAKHEDFDYTEEYGYPYNQYIVEVDDLVIYHAGDTLLYEGMLTELAKWDIDIAFIPINGRDSLRYRRNCMGCMTWQEAADFAAELQVGVVCPAHWEMFSDNSENPYLFTDYCRVKYPQLEVWVDLPSAGGVYCK